MFGLGLATALTNLGMFLMITIYASCLPAIKESIFWPDRTSFQGWGEYFKIGVPASVMLCAEFWATTIMIFLAGIIGMQSQAAMIIVF